MVDKIRIFTKKEDGKCKLTQFCN